MTIKHGALAATAIALLGVSTIAAATPTYTVSGPGTVSVSQTGDDASMTYNGSGSGTWTISAVADTTGLQTFDFDSSGFYAFFNVYASASAFSGADSQTLYSTGPANCCSSPSSGFHYTGSVVLDLVQGQTYGFTVHGQNSDSNPTIAGTFSVSPDSVPEPAMLGLFGMGAVALGLSRRRKAA